MDDTIKKPFRVSFPSNQEVGKITSITSGMVRISRFIQVEILSDDTRYWVYECEWA